MAFYVRALRYFHGVRASVFGLVLLIAGGMLLSLALPWPTAVLIDRVLVPAAGAGDASTFGLLGHVPGGVPGQIAALAAVTLLLKALQELLKLCQTLLGHRVNYAGLLAVRHELFAKLQAMSVGYHRSRNAGDAIYRVISDAHAPGMILNTLIPFVVAVGALGVMVAVMALQSLLLTAVALGVVPVLVAANVWYGRVLTRRSAQAREVESQFVSGIQRNLASVPLVQAFNRQADEIGRFNDSVQATVRAWFDVHRQEVAYWLVVGLTFGVGSAAVFGVGGYLVWQGRQAGGAPSLTPGGLLVFLSYLGMLFDPLCKVTGLSYGLASGRAAAQRIFEVLDADVVVHEPARPLPLPLSPRRLQLHDVDMAYDAGKPVLRGIDVTVEPGSFVAFVGPSGGGKSTLLNLLPRFHDPSDGRVTLDGIDLRDASLADVRRHVAVVLQDVVTLPTSVAENIAYGRPDATEADVRHAAELAGATAFIDDLPKGMQTRLAEGGSNLSGGQRQRLAVARALLTRAPILVLDEPTSALDPEHERHVIDSLQRIRGGRTVVLVTHRLAAVTSADRIYVLLNGRIEAAGTHEALLAAGGTYARMHRQEQRQQRLAEAA
ncbi:MAG: ABC transporter ATP-binding protein [Phycisphaerae bacterium]